MSATLSDAELVEYATKWYGPVMGCKVEEVFGADPVYENGFANSVRRSLTREAAERAAAHTHAKETT